MAFKTAVFMPMAISAFAAAVIWRVMDQKDPDIGAVNAMVRVGYDYVHEPGVLSAGKAVDRRDRRHIRQAASS